MSSHLDALKQMLDPEVYDDYVSRYKEILPMREEIASEVRDLNPSGVESLAPEAVFLNPWIINWIRKRGGLKDMETWNELLWQQVVEWECRFADMFPTARKIAEEKPPIDELITTKWLSFLSLPPTYVVRGDITFSSNQLLYGKYATVLWCNVDYWTGEFTYIGGYHVEDGVPVTFWMVGFAEQFIPKFTEEDLESIKRAAPDFGVSEEWVRPEALHLYKTDRKQAISKLKLEDMIPENFPVTLNRRHLRLGIKLRDMPKKRPYDLHEWLRPTREILMDLREEQFAAWTHATLYVSLAPGIVGVSTQNNLWGMSGWWHDPYYAMLSTEKLGLPMQFYTYEPLPPILNTLLALPKETFIRRLAAMHFSGPKGLICDPICKLVSPERRTPLLYDIRRLMFEEGKMYKDFATPHDDGIPPPRALLTSIFAPLYKEANIRDFIANPDNLPKEYWDFLESEGGVDRKTGRIPPYSETPRLKWLFDPTIEWLNPKDFLPVDWSRGQVWPIDITREKIELMVEEGYDGSGKDILHYSALADRKMGQGGETIMLGTIPYKLPTE